MYCSSCGKKLSEGARYCMHCGRRVETETAGSTYRYVPTGEKARFVMDNSKESTPRAEVPRSPAPAAARKPKRRSLLGRFLRFWLVVLLSAVVSLAAQEGVGWLDGLFAKSLPSVPKELQEHVFLRGREMGPCGKLRGDVGITVIFVDDLLSSWTQEQRDTYMTALYADIWGIVEDAALWNAQVQPVVDVRHCSVPELVTDVSADQSVEEILMAAKINPKDPHGQLRGDLDAEHTAVVFVLNKAGRASAQQGNLQEYCLLFSDSGAFRHELYHLFGAEDLYYPSQVTTLAESCFGESIMLGYENDTVDALTAYLLGWTDELSENALYFLKQTAWVTEEIQEEAYAQEAFTGYGSREYAEGIYTGNLTMGVPTGWGTLELHNGDRFEGNFVNGVRTGTGRYDWNNGDWYQGAYENDLRTGWGSYHWANGNWYEGSFVEDEICGVGTFYWTDGSSYHGEFRDSMLHGSGTLTYPDGRTVSGVWRNNEYQG